MTSGPERPPLIYLDVDGPLIPFGLEPSHYPSFEPLPQHDENPLLGRLDPSHGPRLRALPGELVWATTWLHDANDSLSPRLGLPRLPVVDWPEPSDSDEFDARIGLHWKTRPLLDHAQGRPFAWIDDEISGLDRDWVSGHHAGPALLHRVDPQRGLTGDDYRELDEWLRESRRS
ncbi:HAD domain-containing protein [Amycolatopsis sp. EV170708-02-1]|uniref:HAD domain-containing protein n=1 Tax=Amycolatopsis sp. EV170708-02-1 TaxID=2919322 RepID=UPI001F0CCA07|nr:HAD domain-containing protein [Amycolatopsis sp. EV170708-02-1]UMP05313.1 hypothetical protein MJQ72_10990 [Amycolatopsis sp. EV170708-02-1]